MKLFSIIIIVYLVCLQSTSDGPKRIPVLQQSQPIQKAVVTPTPHQRVLGVSNGPQRVQRPMSHQKPVSNLPLTVKSTHPADQNVNPATQNVNAATQLKPSTQQNQLKTQAPKPNLTKPQLEPQKPEKPQGKCNTKLGNGVCICVLGAKMYPPLSLSRQTCQERSRTNLYIKVRLRVVPCLIHILL